MSLSLQVPNSKRSGTTCTTQGETSKVDATESRRLHSKLIIYDSIHANTFVVVEHGKNHWIIDH